MKGVKSVLFSIVFALSALVAALVLTTVVIFAYHYYKLYFTAQPSKQQLELSEALIRSKELVVSHWRNYQHCPNSAALTPIQELSVVANIEVEEKADRMQCVITIYLTEQDFANKQLKQTIEFRKREHGLVKYSCYHNAVKDYLPSGCQRLRDIDSFNKAS